MKLKLIKDCITDWVLNEDKTLDYADRYTLITYIQGQFPSQFRDLESLGYKVMKDESKRDLFNRELSNLARLSAGNKLIQSLENN